MKVAALTAATNFTLLSHLSDYRFDRLGSFNWDIALMLTPWGIVKNLIVDSGVYLAPYYHVGVEVPAGYPWAILTALVLLQTCVSLFILERLRRIGR